jgi:acyl carrier protein
MTEKESPNGRWASASKLPRAGDSFANETERGVAQVFAEILGVEGVSAEDDIFTLGGDSFQAVRIALELEYRFSIEFPTELLERAWQIKELAAFINAKPRATDTPA